MPRIKFEKETVRGNKVIHENVSGHRAFLKLIKGKIVEDVYQFKGGTPFHGQIGFKDGSVVKIILSPPGVILRYK